MRVEAGEPSPRLRRKAADVLGAEGDHVEEVQPYNMGFREH